MRTTALRLVIALAVLVLAAFVLNPSPERHRDRIKAEIAARSQLAALLRIGDFAAFVSQYHSLGVASYTTANDRTLSIGVLGAVFVLEPPKD